MKQHSFLILLGSFLFIMLMFPTATFTGASNGLLLWFQTILPTLLPFVILSNLLIQTNAVYYIAKCLSPIFKPFFCVSEYGCYAILIGFLCGYPMGAKVISDLISAQYISQKEGKYLLSFCNNTSPMFIISYVLTQTIKNEKLLIPSLLILLASPILCSFLFRKYYKMQPEKFHNTTLQPRQLCFHFQIIDDAIMNGFDTLTRIGGYIILFSILISLCRNLPCSWFISILEISNGILLLKNAPLTDSIKYIAILSLTSFGGLCAAAQTYSMINEVKLPIAPYITQKLITATVTSLFALLYLLLIHR